MTTRSLRDDILDILARVHLAPDGSASVDAKSVPQRPAPGEAPETTAARALSQALYRQLYAKTRDAARPAGLPAVPALSHLHSDQLRAIFQQALAGAPREGASESAEDAWHFFRIGARQAGIPLTRVYWNLAPTGAIRLVRALVRALAPLDAATHFKVLRGPSEYRRADSAVLYFPSDRWDDVARAVAAVHPAVRAHARADTPLFTLRLAHGLALAEDPGNGESFGMHRCRLLADALMGHRRERPDAPWDADALVDRVAHAIPPHATHLRPGSGVDYAGRLPAGWA